MRRSVTPREEEVLVELRRGEANKSIARSLGISEQAVKAHVSRLFLKFGVGNRAGLATAAALRDDAAAREDLVAENDRLRKENGILRDSRDPVS